MEKLDAEAAELENADGTYVTSAELIRKRKEREAISAGELRFTDNT